MSKYLKQIKLSNGKFCSVVIDLIDEDKWTLEVNPLEIVIDAPGQDDDGDYLEGDLLQEAIEKVKLISAFDDSELCSLAEQL